MYNKKRTYRKKRVYRKVKKTVKRVVPKTGFFKVIRWSSNDAARNCHFFAGGNDLVPSSNFALTFAMDNVNGVGELKSLFDNYRIIKVLYRFVLMRNPNSDQVSIANRGLYPRINWVHDFNDSTAISRAQMYQHGGLREFFFTEDRQATKWYTLKPSSLVQMYESGTTTAYQPRWLQWMDTSDSGAPHYGIKVTFDQLYSNVNLHVEAKLIIECKGIS